MDLNKPNREIEAVKCPREFPDGNFQFPMVYQRYIARIRCPRKIDLSAGGMAVLPNVKTVARGITMK
jgi:hypothetical protein